MDDHVNLVGTEAEQESIARSLEPGATAATSGYERSGQTEHLEGYDPYSFSKELEKLDEMSKTLETVKQNFNKCSMGSLLLNADVVTMFDPVSSEQLKSIVMSCNKCADKIADMQTQSIDKSSHNEDKSSHDEGMSSPCTLAQDSMATSETETDTQEPMEHDQSINPCSTDQPLHED